jgi:hypothetical protein
MKAEFIGDRKIRISELPAEIAGEPNKIPAIEVCIEYTGETNAYKALPLDKFVIPVIVDALNGIEEICAKLRAIAEGPWHSHCHCHALTQGDCECGITYPDSN